MTKEDKELLLKDLCGRLQYGVVCDCLHDYHTKASAIDVEDSTVYYPYCDEWESIEYCKPYLRPMSSMTEEEAKEISILYGIKNILSIKITDECIYVVVDDGVCSTEVNTIWYNEIISSIETFDWLNKKMFDYRGLIPMGLAFAVTEENNPYKS